MNSSDIMGSINSIYDSYRIHHTLRKHMLRVASVGALICDNWNGRISKEDVVAALLIHDLGNIVKFDLSYDAKLVGKKEIIYWRKIQRESIRKYGKDDSKANIMIAKELKVNESIMNILEHIGFRKAEKALKAKKHEYKIASYADMRVSPYRVVSLQGRFGEAAKRYKSKKGKYLPKGKLLHLQNCLYALEKQIAEKMTIKPERITDNSIRKYLIKYGKG